MENGAGRPLAAITGASSGIGFELAKVFAAEGYDLIINAEDEELAEAERSLAETGAQVVSIKADLGTPGGVERLYEGIQADGRPLDALAVNAGIGAGGDFVRDTDLDKELQIVDLNVRSVVHLSKLVLKDMVGRNEGRILYTSSIASTMPGSFQAVYNASKSFVQSFALAIRNELKDTDVVITSLMPGPTETEFFARADMEDTKVGAGDKDDPAQVARQGFEALMDGRERVVGGGVKTKVQARLSRVVPDSIKAEQHRKMAEPGSGDSGKDE
jgi:short-subunit dehydrogenase